MIVSHSRKISQVEAVQVCFSCLIFGVTTNCAIFSLMDRGGGIYRTAREEWEEGGKLEDNALGKGCISLSSQRVLQQ